MPKQTVSINKFHKGILNKYDKRDIPEGGLSNLTDLLCDLNGQLRQMGSEIPSSDVVLSDLGITGLLEPGYGIFTFSTDYSIVTGKETPTKVIAIQNVNGITLFDWTYRGGLSESAIASDPLAGIITDEIFLHGGTNDTNYTPVVVRPVYNFADGVLYICNANLDQGANDIEGSVGSEHNKEYRYMRKSWFPSVSLFGNNPTTYVGSASIDNDDDTTLGEWQVFQSYIFPPSVASDGANTHQLYSHTDLKRDSSSAFPGNSNSSRADFIAEMEAGNISISIAEGDISDTGEWMADANHSFGISFQYDGGRESTVSIFEDVMPITNDNVSISCELYAQFDVDGGDDFDKRILGVNLYYTGDTSGIFDDPLWMGYWHWGTNLADETYFESHEGRKILSDGIAQEGSTKCMSTTGNTLTLASGSITTAGLEIKTLPAITFEIRNGYNNTSDTTAARYATSVIAQRKMFVGGVGRVEFNTETVHTANSFLLQAANCPKQCTVTLLPKNLDRLMYGVVNQFGIFPSDNFLDIAINDGDIITHLESFNDRILQFKKNKLYIMNIEAGDPRDSYMEGSYDYMGVDKPCQVVRTELGIAWVNKLGCYFYSGETPVPLTENNILLTSDDSGVLSKFISWNNFIKSTGAIGYIPVNKQLVVFEDPETFTSGDVLIYDMPTKSWTFGSERLSASAKSNIISSWKNTCLYAVNQDASSGGINTYAVEGALGIDASWGITGLSGNFASNPTASYLQINSTPITDTLSFSSTLNLDGSVNFTSDNPNAHNLPEYLMYKILNYSDDFTVVSFTESIVITRNASDIDGTYSGESLTFSQPIVVSTTSINAKTITNLKNFHLESELDFSQSFFYSVVTSPPGHAVAHLSIGDSIDNSEFSNAAGSITDYSSNNSAIANSVLLQHASLATMIPYNSIENTFYNPFNLTPIAHYGETGAMGNDTEISIPGSRRLLNVDTTNYSKIVITGATNYSWATPGTGLTLSFGHGAAQADSVQHVDGVLSDNYWSLFGYPIATGGTSLVYGASNRFTVDGQPLDSGSLLNSTTMNNGAVVIDLDIGSQNNTVKVPSVVYRKFSNPDELHISLLGDQSGQFSVNTEYNIYGGGESGGATHAQAGGVNDLRKFKLNELDVYSHGGTYFSNATVNQTSFTVLIFRLDDQDATNTGTNEPFASGKWDSIVSYGDMCIAGDMTITAETDTTATIVNSQNTGLADTPYTLTAHPYISVRGSQDLYTLLLVDDSGASYSASASISAEDNAIMLSDDLIQQLTNQSPSIASLSRVKIDSPQIQLSQTSGTWDTIKINKNLRDLGVAAGDIFHIHSTSNPTNSGYVTNSYQYGPNVLYKILSIEDHGVTAAGYTFFKIKTNNSDTILLDAILINGSGGDLTTTSDITFDFSTIKLESNEATNYTPLSISGGRSSSVSFKEFSNTKNSSASFLPSKALSIETADFAFGDPGNNKKIYYVDISYTYTSSSSEGCINVAAILNNQSTPIYLVNSIGETDLESTDRNAWRTTRLYFHIDKTPIVARSLRLNIHTAPGHSISNFKLNDISLSIRQMNR